MRYHETLVARFASKVVLDILPATAASLIGGLLFAHYGLGRVPTPAAAAQVEPASTEMMRLLRDEHGLIVSFLNAQLEHEKTELAAEDIVRRGSSEGAAATSAPMRISTAVVASPKSGSAHTKLAATASSVTVAAVAPAASAPLVIAQIQQPETAGATSQVSQLLIAKTAGLKDHVVSVTHHVVSALGGIPGWIGDHLGGIDAKSQLSADMITTS